VGLLRGMLIPRFLETFPVRVYALASHWGFEEEAKIASGRTLTLDISKDMVDGRCCMPETSPPSFQSPGSGSALDYQPSTSLRE